MRRSAGTGHTTELVILGSRGQYGWLVYSKLNAVRKGVPGDGGATRPKQSLATTQRPQRLTPPHPCEKERALRRPVVHFSVTTQTRAGGEICLAPPRRVQPGILTQPRMRARASPSRAASRGSRVPAAAEHRRSEFSMRRSAETGHSPELVIPGSGSQYERQSSRLIYSKLMLTTSKWNRSGGRALTGDALMEAQVL
jgi:hypothetical protein